MDISVLGDKTPPHPLLYKEDAALPMDLILPVLRLVNLKQIL